MSFFTQKWISIDILETVFISFRRSFQPLIRRLMIMLPLHGQNTAAIDYRIEQAVPIILIGDVFGKQADKCFAEFL